MMLPLASHFAQFPLVSVPVLVATLAVFPVIEVILVPAILIVLFAVSSVLFVTMFVLVSVRTGTVRIVTVPVPFGCKSIPMFVSVPFAARAITCPVMDGKRSK